MTEQWRGIQGWPYSVSNKGRVRNDRTGRVLKPAPTLKGYLRVSLYDNRERPLQRFVHQLVLRAFGGAPLPGQQVNHVDGNKANNAVDNLEWVTGRGNKAHAWATGLYSKAFGEETSAAVLTDALVMQIRDGDEPAAVWARRVGVHPSTIRKARSGRSWPHLPRPDRRTDRPIGGEDR